MKAKLPPFTIGVDTREQLPYSFVNSVSMYIETGDYIVVESPLLITIDRKTQSDIIGTVTNNRERFIKELERMAEYDFKAIVMECTLQDLLGPYKRSKANPKSVCQSLFAFQSRYNVNMIFAGNRILGKTSTLSMLTWAWHKKCLSLGII